MPFHPFRYSYTLLHIRQIPSQKYTFITLCLYLYPLYELFMCILCLNPCTIHFCTFQSYYYSVEQSYKLCVLAQRCHSKGYSHWKKTCEVLPLPLLWWVKNSLYPQSFRRVSMPKLGCPHPFFHTHKTLV